MNRSAGQTTEVTRALWFRIPPRPMFFVCRQVFQSVINTGCQPLSYYRNNNNNNNNREDELVQKQDPNPIPLAGEWDKYRMN